MSGSEQKCVRIYISLIKMCYLSEVTHHNEMACTPDRFVLNVLMCLVLSEQNVYVGGMLLLFYSEQFGPLF